MRQIVCFGEVLWDLLPTGRFLGGAPLNVAYHLARLGRRPSLASAVGEDELGREALETARLAGIDTGPTAAHPDLSTGSVEVRLDEHGQASYRFAEPAAWDRIAAEPDPGGAAEMLVHGSLALRREHNRALLERWSCEGVRWRVFDVNLRPPFDRVEAFGRFFWGADLIKVNLEEARRLASGLPDDAEPERLAPSLGRSLGGRRVCITLGSEGAVLWDGKNVFRAVAPAVKVRDTVGAGDAFTAALADGILSSGPEPDWERLLRRACALGSWVASRDGAQPSYRVEEVEGLTMEPASSSSRASARAIT